MLAWETLWLLIWTIGGGINLVDQWWSHLGYSALITGIAFIFSLSLISSILNLPFSLYQTFVIEERFGFNQTNLENLDSGFGKDCAPDRYHRRAVAGGHPVVNERCR